MRLFASVVAFVCALLVALPAQAATTFSVPSQYATIQQAIDAAADGDTILVAPGTYSERIDFGTKDITVASTSGAAVTVVDGGFLGTVVTMAAEAGESPTLRGFTITNGRRVGSSDGGGVATSGGRAVIEDNIIAGNEACVDGGGIEARFSQALIRRNRIANNGQTSACIGGPGGGGVFIGGSGSVVLVDNVVTGNSQGSFGGGVTLFAAGNPTVARNVISGNSTGLHGGGIWIVNRSDAQIENNLIYGNTAAEGGGVWWGVPSGARGPVLVNNTIVDNTAATGSALFADGFDSTARAANNIFRGDGTSVVHCGNFDSNPPALEFNDVLHANGGLRYGGICGDLTGTNGNVSVNPSFVDPSNADYHLAPLSALVDIGTSTGVPTIDIDGEARTVDGDGDGVPETDIGADEAFSFVDVSPPTLSVPAPFAVDATSPQGATVTFTASAVDNADPNPTVSCTPSSGSDFAIGATTVSCTATDAAGNSASASFTVTVRGALEQIAVLRAQVVMLPDERLGRSLDAKLRDAATAVSADQKPKACSKLQAFISEVQVHAGGKIPASTSAAWIADATRIRAVIGC